MLQQPGQRRLQEVDHGMLWRFEEQVCEPPLDFWSRVTHIFDQELLEQKLLQLKLVWWDS